VSHELKRSSNKFKLSKPAAWLAILAVVIGPQSLQPLSPAAASNTTISDPGNNCHIDVTSETVVVDSTSVSVSLVGTRCLVKFLTAGSYSVTMPDGVVALDYLVVGAGGGGGSGGGGAGGVLQGTNYEIDAANNYVVSVGAGGQGGSGGSGSAPIDATNGENSAFGTITALGGGHGGQGNLHAGDGASGGGSQYDCTSVECAGSGTPGQGTDGAPSTHPSYGGGAGGGGAGGAGGNTVLSHIGGNGGTGVISSITGVATYYGGGGGGGINSNDDQYCGLNPPGTSDQDYYCSQSPVTTGGGDGGLGGGGKGSSWGFTGGNYGELANGTPGEPNTGGGGGGTDPEDAYAYAGGSGIVVLSYVSSASYRKITFDSNNGSGVTAEQNVESGAATELRSNPFTYDGYVFQGWNTQADGNGTNFGNRTTFTTTNEFTLYAQWAEGVDHTVTFDSNGGTGDQEPQVAGLPTVLDDNQFVRPGYTFTGWNTKRTGYGYSYSDNAFFAFDFDATLYAQWSLDKVTHSVNFYGNGATSGTTSSQIGSSTAPLNANGFQRTGYNFLGWHTSDWASWTEYLDLQNYSFEQDLSLYAIWVPQYTNTVYFDGNGASSGSMQNQDASSLTLLEANGFARDGFTFLNWNTAPDGTGVNYQSTYSYNFGQGVVLYAIWGQNFTVSYSGNGNTGGLKPDSQSAVVGGESLTFQSNSRNLSKTQYLLAGWNTSADGSGTRYALGQTKVSLSGDVTLYAQWVAEEVTVTYEYDGADGGNSTAIEFYTYGTSGLILPTPTKTDYTFRGWYSSSSLMRLLGYGGTSYTPPAYSLTNSIYAKWSPKSAGPEQQTLEIYGGIIDEEHPINSPDPYTETSTDGGLTWHPAYLVGGDHPWGNVEGTNSWLNCAPSFFECLGVRSDYRYRFYLAPGWSASNLTASMIMDNYGWVTLNGTDLSGYQEGNWNSPGAIPVDQITHTGWNELYVVLVDQGGYAGINFHLTFNVTSPTPIKVLEPGTPNTLKVQFNLQGAPVSYAAQTYTLGGDALLIPTPTRDGYSFMGWAKGSLNGAVVQPGSFTPDDNVTLYALWDAPSHTASFDSNGGSAVADVLFADDGGTVAKPKNPTRSGYRFLGWSNTEGGNAVSFPYTPGAAQDITLYALWSADSHTVTYDSKGGSSVVDGTFITEGSVAIPYDPTRKGYSFLGWSATDGGSPVTFPYSPGATTDITLYALWAKNQGTQEPMVLEQTITYAGQLAFVPLTGTVDNITVDWGDGIIDGPFNNPIEATHTYANPGTYTVSISGTELTRFGNGCRWNETLTKVVSFGSIGITNLENAFACAPNLTSVPATLPEGVTTLAGAFYYSSSFNQDLTGWETSSVTTFNNMFYQASSFNGDISTWDTGNAVYMNSMFYGASSFNQNLSNWDTHSLVYMNAMFKDSAFNNGSIGNDSGNPLRADGNKWNLSNVTDISYLFQSSPFNQDVGNWDLSNATNFAGAFAYTQSFDQNISGWNTASGVHFQYMFLGDNFNNGGQPLVTTTNGWNLSNAVNIFAMFQSNKAFNQDISSWDITNVTNLNYMFYDASAFNNGGQPLTWDTSNIETMEAMFRHATAFNADISSWNMSNVVSTFFMFNNAQSFQSVISQWDVSKIQNMNGMFGNSTFNGYIGDWDTSSVRYMSEMFYENRSFDTDISKWNTSNVEDMSSMFRSSNFNHPLNNWNVGKVVNMNYMFLNAELFNQPLASWDVSNVVYVSSMFQNTRSFSQPLNGWNFPKVLSTDNMFYNSIFNGDISQWNTSGVQDMSGMFASTSEFNQDISNWDVSNVVNFTSMFQFATAFNQPIGQWDVSQMRLAYYMFNGASEFNQDLNNWNTSNLRNAMFMFEGATNFNGDISDWNTSNLTSAGYMFKAAFSFNQDISNWDVSNITDFSAMFQFAKSFNQPLGSWEVSQMQSAYLMFYDASEFNQDLSSWNTGQLISAWGMFYGAKEFNGNISNWDTHSLSEMTWMFGRAFKFNQDLSNWDFSNVDRAANAFDSSGLNKVNYTKLLISLNNQNMRPITISFGGVRYLDSAAAARANLVTPVESGGKGLSIEDSGQFSWLVPVVYKKPTAADIRVGQSLADSNLSGAVTNVSGTWTFTDPTLVPASADQNVSITFTPDDAENYQPITTEINIHVSYKQRTITFTGSNPTKWVTGSFDASATPSIGSGTVTYSILSGDCSINANGILSATASGTCSFRATIASDGTYESVSVDGSATLRTYLVTFDSKSGSVVNPQHMDVSGSVLAPSDPTRPGYKFLGWSATDGGNSVVFPYAPEITDDITLYALWSAASHNVTYNSNGGSSVAADTFVTDGSLAIPFDPIRTGYAFLGWSASDGGESITFPYLPGVTTDVTLYALWSANTYAVNYNTKNGSALIAGSFTAERSFGSNSQILDGSVPPSQASGLAALELGVNLSTNQDGWVRNVSFFKYEGDQGGHSAQVWSADGKLLGSQEFLTETSSGWQTLTLTKPVFIAAGKKFTVSVYGATYSFAYTDFPKRESGPLSVLDGSFIFASQSSYPENSGTWSYGIDLDFMTASDVAPTRTGYALAGWSATDGGALLDFPYSPGVSTDITLYAKWIADSHEVTFDSKSGSTVSARSFVTDGSVTAPAIPTRAGYSFVGWSATDGGSPVTFPYSPGVLTDITLYAKWIAGSHMVTFNSNGGSDVNESSFETAGSVAIPNDPIRAGYSFLGWSTTDGGSPVTFPYSPGVLTDITLYAKWAVDTHVVTFDSKNGSVVSAGSFVTAGSVAAPSAPTRVGSNFIGWSATDGGSPVTFPYSPGVTTDVTLYALWSEIIAPSAPRNVTATAGNKAATVTWEAPISNGGSAITSYLITASTGQTCSTVALTCTITGLLNKTAVTFTVVAINSAGNGAVSAPSASTTPYDPNDDELPPEGDGGLDPKAIPSNGKFVATNDSTFQVSWDKKNGKLISRATGIYTGYIEAKMTFTKAGKTYSCTTVFGILKVMPQKTAAQKSAAMKLKTFTGKQFCIDKIKMDPKSVAPKGGMTAANFKKIKSMNKSSAEASKEKAALAALKGFSGVVEVKVIRYRAWPTTMLNRGDHTGKGGKIPALIRNTKVTLG